MVGAFYLTNLRRYQNRSSLKTWNEKGTKEVKIKRMINSKAQNPRLKADSHKGKRETFHYFTLLTKIVMFLFENPPLTHDVIAIGHSGDERP